MKASRFSLADLITLLAALLFGFICFLGLNFITEGDLVISLLVSIGIGVILGGLALAAKLQKRVMRDFKAHIISEFSLIILFTLLFFGASYLVFPHYFTVSSKKEDIKRSLLTSIDEAEQMFERYEVYAKNREQLYEANLRSVVAAKKTKPQEYADYGFGYEGISDSEQIENKMFTLHADLFPTNYSDTIYKNGTKDVAIKWLMEQKEVVSNWKPIGVPIVSNELSDKATQWRDELIQYSQVRERGETANDFAFEHEFSVILYN